MVLYQQGDYQAFEELYHRHSGKVYGYLKLHAPTESEDLLQQVVLKWHHSRLKYDPKFPFLAWIFAITRNTVVDAARKHKPVTMESDKLISLADESKRESLGGETLSWDELLKPLTADQQKLLRLRFQEGLSFDEIAVKTGTTGISARKRVSRTIQGLRRALGGKK